MDRNHYEPGVIYPHEKSFTHYPIKTRALDIQEDPDGKFLQGCDDGLYMFDPENSDALYKLTGNSYTPSVIRDRQGTVWASSFSGLRQLNYSNHKKFNIYRQFGNIGHIAEDINHELWILAFKDKVSGHIIFRASPSFERVYQRNFPDSREWVCSLFLDKREMCS